MNAKPLSQLVDPSWLPALEPVEPIIHEIGQRLRTEVSAGRGYLPAGANVLRAFTQPLPAVKVLIVGQDPYPTPGHAVGLSFSVAPGVKPPKSLQNIFKELHADLGLPIPTSGDLTPWSQRGVLLLNRVLTVSPGQAASHQGWGWEKVTEAAIKALAARDSALVAILWGRDAQNTQKFLGDTACICSPHPSPLSAARGFFGSKPFSHANELLVQQGAEPVNWQL